MEEESDQDLSDEGQESEMEEEDQIDDVSDDASGAKRKAKLKRKNDQIIANRALRIKMGKSGA